MATRRLALRLNVDAIEGLAERIARVDRDAVGKVLVDGINEVLDRTYDLARGKMIAGINLDDGYVRRKMTVRPATNARPEGQITAAGGAQNLTVLGRFNAQPSIVPARSPASRLKGNKALGLSPGLKQQGVSVEVRRGAVDEGFVPRGFLLPLRAGKQDGGNGLGVFARNVSGKKIHRYGPSVYQLFAYQLDALDEDIQDDLSTTVSSRVAAAIEKALE